jgi:phage-related protein
VASKTYEIAFQLGAKIASNFGSTFSSASKSIQNLENQSKAANKGFLGLGEGASKVVSTLAGLGGIVGAGLGIKAMFDSASAGQQKLAQMDAVLKSTGGAAGMTKQQLLDLAAAQGKVTTFSKGTNIATENLLLTFTGIGDKVFPDVLKATNDMATAMGMDTSSAALTLGKALNDPATGLTKLTKQGVTFTAEQQNQIKAMVAAGDTAGAQSMMLKELQREFGGSAEAAGKTFAGQLTILKNNISGVGSSIATTLMPYITKFMTLITDNLPIIQSTVMSVVNTVTPYIAAVMSDVAQIASNVLPDLSGSFGGVKDAVLGLIQNGLDAFKEGMDFIAQHGDATREVLEVLALAVTSYGIAVGIVTAKQKAAMIIEALSKAWFVATGIIGAMREGMSLASIAQLELNAAMEANPIGAITLVVMALIGACVLLYQNWDTVSSFFSGVWESVKNAFSSFWEWLKNFLSQWGTVILAVVAPFLGVPLLIAQHWDQIKETLGAVWDKVKSAVSSAWESIKNSISSAWTSIKTGISNAWNAIVNAITNSPLFKVISAIFKGILAVVIVVVYNLYTRVVAGWTNIFNTAKSVLTAVWSFITSIWNKIYTTISNVLTQVWTVITSVWNKIYSTVSSVVTSVWNVIVTVWSTIYSTVSSILTTVWNVIVTIWNNIYNAVSSVLQTIWTFITTVWNNVYTTVSSIVTNIWNTIVSGFTSAYDGIVSIFGSIKDTISNIFMDIWEIIKSVINTGIGMINGFIGGVNSVIDTANKVPGVHIETVSNIPQLANGGYIKHRPGGILANIGEGNEDEIVSPVSKLKSIINSGSTSQQQQAPISYSPQIIIQGNASKDDVVQALSISKAQFKQLMDDYNSGKGRLSFNQG